MVINPEFLMLRWYFVKRPLTKNQRQGYTRLKISIYHPSTIYASLINGNGGLEILTLSNSGGGTRKQKMASNHFIQIMLTLGLGKRLS